jgi:hypothetical protein
MDNEPSQSAKPRFYEVCQMYHLKYQNMQDISNNAGLSKQVIDAMSVSVAVKRVHAIKILAALSEHTGKTWTLNDVKIVLLPTFQDLHTLHQFDLEVISTTSGISFDIIGMMLRNEPVPVEEAKPVLRAASKQTGQTYTITNVDVKLTRKEQS